MPSILTQIGLPKTLGEVLAPLIGVPLDRIRVNPAPGSATVGDVIEIYEREGGTILPGFGLSLAEVFAELDRRRT